MSNCAKEAADGLRILANGMLRLQSTTDHTAAGYCDGPAAVSRRIRMLGVAVIQRTLHVRTAYNLTCITSYSMVLISICSWVLVAFAKFKYSVQ